MELRVNGSIPQPIATTARPNLLRDADFGRSNSVAAVVWWVSLMLAAALVPGFAALVLMGSVTLAAVIGLITAGGVGLAALMI